MWDYYANARLEQRHGLTLTQAAASEPVSLNEAKLHCRVDPDLTDDDGLIADLVSAARDLCERQLCQRFVTQSWKLTLDRFPGWQIDVPLAPLQSVTSIQYVDPSGVTQTWLASNYAVDALNQPGRITPTYLVSYWPVTRFQMNSVLITFVVGYGAAGSVPQPIKQAIKMLAAHWYVNRESVVIGAIPMDMKQAFDALLWSVHMGNY